MLPGHQHGGDQVQAGQWTSGCRQLSLNEAQRGRRRQTEVQPVQIASQVFAGEAVSCCLWIRTCFDLEGYRGHSSIEQGY